MTTILSPQSYLASIPYVGDAMRIDTFAQAKRCVLSHHLPNEIVLIHHERCFHSFVWCTDGTKEQDRWRRGRIVRIVR